MSKNIVKTSWFTDAFSWHIFFKIAHPSPPPPLPPLIFKFLDPPLRPFARIAQIEVSKRTSQFYSLFKIKVAGFWERRTPLWSTAWDARLNGWLLLLPLWVSMKRANAAAVRTKHVQFLNLFTNLHVLIWNAIADL